MQSDMRLIERRLPKEWEKVELSPLSDVHPESPEFNPLAFDRYLDWIDAAHNRLMILAGDLFEAATKRSKSDVYSATMNPQEACDFLVKKLKPRRDRILGACEGNHELRILKEVGMPPTRYVADVLSIPYRPHGLPIKLVVGYRKAKGKSHPIVYTIYATHGWGGGRTKGAKANKLEYLSSVVQGADLYLIAHLHDIVATPINYMIFDTHKGILRQQTAKACSAGSFLNWGGYAQQLSYKPGSQEMPLITFSGREKDVRITI